MQGERCGRLFGSAGKNETRRSGRRKQRTMNRRKDLLNALAEREPYDGLLLSDDEIRALFQKLTEYYELNDIETRNNHGAIFKTLYVDGGYKNYEKTAAENYVSTYTLDRYRQRYNKFAERLLKEKILRRK